MKMRGAKKLKLGFTRLDKNENKENFFMTREQKKIYYAAQTA